MYIARVGFHRAGKHPIILLILGSGLWPIKKDMINCICFFAHNSLVRTVAKQANKKKDWNLFEGGGLCYRKGWVTVFPPDPKPHKNPTVRPFLRESGLYGLIGVLTLKLYMLAISKKKKKDGRTSMRSLKSLFQNIPHKFSLQQ